MIKSFLLGFSSFLIASQIMAYSASYQSHLTYEQASPASPRLHDLHKHLAAAFYEDCPDIWCEGDYSDWRPIDLACSLSLDATPSIKECLWLLSGSEWWLDPGTGELNSMGVVKSCRFQPNLTYPLFLQTMSQKRPLDRDLGGFSLRSLLNRCL